jgi:DNA-binding transcriptional LysR family regulator
VPHNLLGFAEAGLGVAVIPSVVQTHRYALRLARITHERKPLREPLAVVWDKRRKLPRCVQDFCETLAAHMHELSSVTRQPVPKPDGPNKRCSPARTKVR